MPELPEVETLVRRLAPSFEGRALTGLWCNWPRMLTPSLRPMQSALIGATLRRLWRRAKWLVWDFGNAGSLMLHLRMSGRPIVMDDAEPTNKHVHFIMSFDGRVMQLEDARKFGRATWTRDVPSMTARLGIEPLGADFTPAWLHNTLRARSRFLKQALLDQGLIAGLGNIYADEALFRARLHPLRRTDSLRADQVSALHAAIITTLRTGIDNNGASIDWVYPEGGMQNHFHAYGRTGQPCGNCKTPIRRLVVGQRGTHICPRCQRGPRGPRRN